MEEYLQVIGAVIFASASGLSILRFSAMRKNTSIQEMQQTYATTTQSLFSSFNSKEYLQMPQILSSHIIHW